MHPVGKLVSLSKKDHIQISEKGKAVSVENETWLWCQNLGGKTLILV